MSDSPTLPGLAALLQTQQKAFRAEGPVSAATRKERLQRVIDMLVKHNEALCKAMGEDFGGRPVIFSMRRMVRAVPGNKRVRSRVR